MLQLAEMYIGV